MLFEHMGQVDGRTKGVRGREMGGEAEQAGRGGLLGRACMALMLAQPLTLNYGNTKTLSKMTMKFNTKLGDGGDAKWLRAKVNLPAYES